MVKEETNTISYPNLPNSNKNTSIGVFREEEIHGEPFLIYNFSSQTHIPIDSNSHNIGVFREGELDGIPFIMYTFSSQSDIPTSSGEAAIDSRSENVLSPLQPRFICPSSRLKLERLKREESSDDKEVLPLNTSPNFPNIRSVDEQVQHLFDPDNDSSICKLPLSPILFRTDDNSHSYSCTACETTSISGTSYYCCVTHNEMFHKECAEAPLEIKHPSYPFLSLQLYTCPNTSYHLYVCITCEKWVHDMFYHCPTYNLNMHPFCAMKPIAILIDHPKRHPHSLTFFPKQNSLLCNVCGVIKALIPTYVCARCVFVVHQDCIYFPFVIRISRHQHRISFTYSLPSRALSCGVCRKKVDKDCGAYSCNKCVDYFVHTRCALREDLWDGEELEGVAEEPEIVVQPFETIANGIILHFSHGHHLKLELSSVYDDDKFCQACILPIYEGNYYSCMDECGFILHESCANAPRGKYHPLHAHPLTLKVVTNEYQRNQGHFTCCACQRKSCGFVYEDPEAPWRCRLDLQCASVFEPFKYEGHEHPLFLALTPKEEESTLCQICQSTYYCDNRKLNCIECDYVICFACATLPYKARYKHDKHFLTFLKGKEASGESGWCEVCESKIVYSREGGFYSCDDCCTTLHVDCLLGSDPYMKPGLTIHINSDEVHTLGNNTMSRPFCHGPDCDEDHRCPYKVVFEKKNKTFCSYDKAMKYYM